MSERVAVASLEPRRRFRGDVIVYAAVAVVFTLFVGSTIPGMRPQTGYNLALDGFLNNIAYELCAVLCFVRARKDTSFRASWRLLGVGLALYGLGNIYWTLFVRTLDPEPWPSPADALWLSFYPFAFVALLLVIRDMSDRLPLSLWLDGIVGGLAVGAVAAALFGPIMVITGGSNAATVVTTLAYPLLDVLLLLVTTAVLALFHWRPPFGLWCMAAGLILFSVADAIYLFAATNGWYESGGVNDGVWVLATLVIAFAPGWPRRPVGVALPAWALLGIPVIATLAALGLLVFDHEQNLHPVALFLAAATVVFALGRLIVTFNEANALAHSRELALTDELTGLANRRAFYETCQETLRASNLKHHSGALLLLDLDRFKEVNDSLGHHAGDDLLREVARRIRECLSTSDYIARLGGDEFAVLLDPTSPDHAVSVADQVRRSLDEPFSVDGVMVKVDASVGVSLFPQHGSEVATLLRHSDIAMYKAKSHRSGVHLFESELDGEQGQERLRMLEELREAIRSRSLEVHYQPKIDTQTNAVNGVEALVRWNHPRRGLLFPDSFLQLAEDAGLMRDLTLAVLEQSLDQVVQWRTAGRNLSVAVNLSASSLVDLELPEMVWRALFDRSLPAEVLELEITEDFLMGDRERARDILSQLRRLGVRVAVDDFGTGYSSLAYLRELPIDELKLDRSFVTPMSADPRAAAIVESTIGLAHSLGLILVAEGVEDIDTAERLAQSGCDQAQGWYFSKALPPTQLDVWLSEREGAGSSVTTVVIAG
jgi:diguanylate cyclase (GGDEF)-like protein